MIEASEGIPASKSFLKNQDYSAPGEAVHKSRLDSRFKGCSEAFIWKEYKRGSREAFVYIYDKYFPVLYNYGHQLSSNKELIEDCIQELFVDLSKKGKQLSDTTSIKFYLIKCLRNRFLKTMKRDNRTKEHEKYFSGYEFQFSLSVEQKIINAQLDHELIEKLNQAILQLTDRQREAIYYYFYEGLSIDEIADLMNVTNRRTVQNLIYRAIAFLRNHFEPVTLLVFLSFLSHSDFS